MAVSRFAGLVSDESELQIRGTAVPVKTKVATEWGFGFGMSGLRNDLHLLSMELFQLYTMPLLEIPPADLAYWMGNCFGSSKEKWG